MENGMLKLRVSVILLILWQAVILNIERLYEPINLASFVYVFMGLMAAGIVLTPKLRTVSLIEITLVSLPVYAFVKWFLGYSFLGPSLPITVTECVVLCVTNVLAWRVAHQIDEFIRVAGELSAIRFGNQDHAACETRMYQEVQRARRFERHLALATVAFRGDLKAAELDRLTQQVRREIARKYLESRIGQALSAAISPGDLCVYRDGEFVLVFPEATDEGVRYLMEGVAREVGQELGVTLQVGVAQFPEEECTLTGLIERAESESRSVEWQDAAIIEPDTAERVPLPTNPS